MTKSKKFGNIRMFRMGFSIRRLYYMECKIPRYGHSLLNITSLYVIALYYFVDYTGQAFHRVNFPTRQAEVSQHIEVH